MSCVVTGIHPEVAQRMTAIGVILGGLRTDLTRKSGLLAFSALVTAAVAGIDYATLATWFGSWWIGRCFDRPTLVDAPSATGDFRVPNPRVWMIVLGLVDHCVHAAAIACIAAIGLDSRDLRDR